MSKPQYPRDVTQILFDKYGAMLGEIVKMIEADQKALLTYNMTPTQIAEVINKLQDYKHSVINVGEFE